MIQRYVNTASTVGTQDGTTNTPGSSGTAAFATLAQALDSLPATLTDQTTISCSGTAPDTATNNQAHWDFDTSATNYLLIQGDNTSGKYDTTKYRLEVTNEHGIYNNNASHVRLKNLQAKITATTSVGNAFNGFRLSTANNTTTGNVAFEISGCIVTAVTTGTDNAYGFSNSDPTTASGGSAAGGTLKIWNCLVHGCYAGFTTDGTAWAAANVINYNCTGYGNENNFMDVQVCINCLGAAHTSGGDFNSTGSSGHLNNASSDGTAQGTNSRTTQTFSFVNPGGGDFHLLSTDAGARTFGLTDPGSGLFSDDIDGQTRTGSWDIGADEVAAPTIALTGTATASITEADVVAGGKTVILTVTGDAVVPATQTPTIGFIANALGGTTTTTSFTVTLPTTLANDIILVCFTHRGTGDGTLSGTTSLTFAKKFEQLYATSTFSCLVYWARATGNHAGETVILSTLTNACAGVAVVYRNCLSSADPFDGAATMVGEQNATGNETQAEITTSVDGCMVVLVIANSPDVTVATHAATNPAILVERAERLSTGGTDASISVASELRTTAGATGAFTWTQVNGVGGSMAFALQPAVLTPFADARAALQAGVDSDLGEGTGWDALKSTTMPVANIVRTSDTVITITLAAAASYNITAQETITATVPATMLNSAQAVVASPTFTIATAGGAASVVPVVQRHYRQRRD